jgi:hypothetical protein
MTPVSKEPQIHGVRPPRRRTVPGQEAGYDGQFSSDRRILDDSKIGSERHHDYPLGWALPHDRSKRAESDRFHRFTYDVLIARDRASLEITWLRDESLDDASTLPAPAALAAEIVWEIEAALAQFSEPAASLAATED